MIYRSKAPLRLGLAGGGTDVSPFSDRFGGATLNATIALYAHATLEITEKPRFVFVAHENGEQEEYEPAGELPITGCLDLLKAVYNCVQRDYGPIRKGFRLSTYVDAPAGSGLGTSSTLAVAILGVFAEMLGLPMGEYDLAHYAFEIERTYLKWAGGKQDQYAATFGGFNYMEFFENDQ
ncbi:MAG TPA: dehydrogenase, partial [Flavisolibacter sp.]|nr:dehydrogenase [Flavisolibacter sp.]